MSLRMWDLILRFVSRSFAPIVGKRSLALFAERPRTRRARTKRVTVNSSEFEFFEIDLES